MQDKLRRRSRWGIIYLAMAVLAAGATGTLVTVKLGNLPFTILVDGKPVATLRTRSEARTVVDSVVSDSPVGGARIAEKVSFRRAEHSAAVMSTGDAAEALSRATNTEASLFTVMVESRPAAAFSSREEAEKALELVKKRFEQNIGHLTSASRIREDIAIHRAYVSTRLFRATAEDGSDALAAVKRPALVHVVRRGDRGVKLAGKYGIPMEDLKRLNPDAGFDALTEGDRILIRPAESVVTVISQAVVKKTEAVSPPGNQGRRARSGKREKLVRVTYENGQPVSEEIISQITTWDRAAAARRRSRRTTRTHGQQNTVTKESPAAAEGGT